MTSKVEAIEPSTRPSKIPSSWGRSFAAMNAFRSNRVSNIQPRSAKSCGPWLDLPRSAIGPRGRSMVSRISKQVWSHITPKLAPSHRGGVPGCTPISQGQRKAHIQPISAAPHTSPAGDAPGTLRSHLTM